MNILETYKMKKEAYNEVKERLDTILKGSQLSSIEAFFTLEAIIKTPNMNQRVIALNAGIVKNTVASVVLNLVEKGLITNTDDPNDKSARSIKRKLLNATDKGKEVYAQLIKQFETTE